MSFTLNSVNGYNQSIMPTQKPTYWPQPGDGGIFNPRRTPNDPIVLDPDGIEKAKEDLSNIFSWFKKLGDKLSAAKGALYVLSSEEAAEQKVKTSQTILETLKKSTKGAIGNMADGILEE